MVLCVYFLSLSTIGQGRIFKLASITSNWHFCSVVDPNQTLPLLIASSQLCDAIQLRSALMQPERVVGQAKMKRSAISSIAFHSARASSTKPYVHWLIAKGEMIAWWSYERPASRLKRETKIIGSSKSHIQSGWNLAVGGVQWRQQPNGMKETSERPQFYVGTLNCSLSSLFFSSLFCVLSPLLLVSFHFYAALS